ncbi:MAG: hypothetical protein CMQ48_06255, partial [Gammaproteobacteria bacterium]|nr:hypothetical protein [Gammaproteobacteria bacterium]
MLVALILVLGCSSSPTNISEESPPQKSTVEYVDELLASAQTQSGSAAAELTLLALETMLNAGFIERAQLEAEQHNLSVDIPSDLRLRYLMVRAQLDLQSG